MTTGQIDPRYGDASATAPPWADIERLLTDAQLYWMITVRADGRPHAVPLVGVWHDGAFAFCTGPEEQKSRNLDANPQVAVTTGSTGANGWASGKDVVVEGTAMRVTDAETLQGLADAWFAKYGEDWKFEVRGAGVRGAEPLRRQHRGWRTGLPGRARQGPRLRRRARPNGVPVLTRAADLARRPGPGGTQTARSFASWLHNAQMITTSIAITASDQNG